MTNTFLALLHEHRADPRMRAFVASLLRLPRDLGRACAGKTAEAIEAEAARMLWDAFDELQLVIDNLSPNTVTDAAGTSPAAAVAQPHDRKLTP